MLYSRIVGHDLSDFYVPVYLETFEIQYVKVHK